MWKRIAAMAYLSAGLAVLTAGEIPNSLFETAPEQPGGQSEILGNLAQLQLDQNQVREVAGIMTSYRDQMAQLVDDLIESRLALAEQVSLARFDEYGVRKAHQRVSSVEEELTVVRAHLYADVLAVMNAEQRKLATDLRKQAAAAVREQVKQARKVMENWLEENGGK